MISLTISITIYIVYQADDRRRKFWDGLDGLNNSHFRHPRTHQIDHDVYRLHDRRRKWWAWITILARLGPTMAVLAIL